MPKLLFKFVGGKVEIDAQGFVNGECLKVTEKLLVDLNPVVEKRVLKPAVAKIGRDVKNVQA